MQHFPECHGASRGGTLPGPAGEGVPWPGGYPGWRGTLAGGVPWLGGTLAGGGYPGWGVPWPGRVPCPGGGYPGQGGTLPGGYPLRTTYGVLATWRAVCLLHSCRRTFLFFYCFGIKKFTKRDNITSKSLHIKKWRISLWWLVATYSLQDDIEPTWDQIELNIAKLRKLEKKLKNQKLKVMKQQKMKHMYSNYLLLH